MTTKISMITLATILTLSSPFALAQSGGHSYHRASAFRSAMNSMPVSQSQHRYWAPDNWSTSRLNGHGIDRLGVTTNSGRMYNGD